MNNNNTNINKTSTTASQQEGRRMVSSAKFSPLSNRTSLTRQASNPMNSVAVSSRSAASMLTPSSPSSPSSSSTLMKQKSEDEKVYQQQQSLNSNSNDDEVDDSELAMQLKSQDFAFYFKTSGQVMKKLENSRPIRMSRVLVKKNDKEKTKAEASASNSTSRAVQGVDDGSTGFMFRWQRDKKAMDDVMNGSDGKGNKSGYGANDDDDDDDDDGDYKGSKDNENGLSSSASNSNGNGGISRVMALTGNVPGTQLSIAAYLGMQVALSKQIPPRVLNQALYSSASTSGKACIATPQQFAIALTSAALNDTPRKDNGSDLVPRRSKQNVLTADAANELIKETVEVDDITKPFITDEEDEANNNELESCVNSLRLASNWPPLAPKFQPPSPDTDALIIENYRRRVISSRVRGPLAKQKRQSMLLTQGSVSKLSLGVSSRKVSLVEQEQSKMQEKAKTSSVWRRPSFMSGGRKSLLSMGSSGPTFYVKRPLQSVLPPPPDPPRPPRGGSSEERRQMEKELQIMFFEDMFSSLLGLKLERAELENKNAELAKMIAETDQAIVSLTESRDEPVMNTIPEKDEVIPENKLETPKHKKGISLSEAYSAGANRPLSTHFT